jgi:hypothetical protein
LGLIDLLEGFLDADAFDQYFYRPFSIISLDIQNHLEKEKINAFTRKSNEMVKPH